MIFIMKIKVPVTFETARWVGGITSYNVDAPNSTPQYYTLAFHCEEEFETFILYYSIDHQYIILSNVSL